MLAGLDPDDRARLTEVVRGLLDRLEAVTGQRSTPVLPGSPPRLGGPSTLGR
jgi:hypothetical protein